MPGLFSRVKTWVSTEDVSYSDLNAEFDNVITYFTPLYMDDYSTNVSQMQMATDPGEVGTESLATTMAGEIARIRFILSEITGEDYWYESPTSSILGLANAIGSGLNANRLVSGRVLTTSSQPAFLVPNGAARTIKLDGTPTSFIYYVNSVEYTISSDVTLTNLTAAPSSNNTCLINDTNAADQYWTKHAGEDGSEIPVDTMGSEISALVGKFAAFKLDNGSASEYFIAYVKSSTSLTKAFRGYFFDSADAPSQRVVYSNNDTITLMKLTWVFAKTDGTLTATYTNPIWSDDEPSSPAIGDYWYDLSASKWKKYDVGAFSDANAMLVGVCIQDATNTIGARSFEFFANYDEKNTVELMYESATEVKSRYPGSVINVWGSTFKFERNIITWDITIDRASGVSEGASTYYYYYITATGDKIISDVKPYDRREDLCGFYHPHESWRCVGFAYNDGSSNLSNVESYYRRYDSKIISPSQTASMNIELGQKIIRLNGSGGAYSEYLPPAALCKGQEFIFVRTDNTIANAVTIDGYGSETINGSTIYTIYTQYETLKIISDGSEWIILSHFCDTPWTDGGVIPITGTTSDPTKGSTQQVDKIYWRRVGDSAQIRYEFQQDSNAGAAAGSGDYRFGLPSNMVINTALITENAVVGSPYQYASCLGTTNVSAAGSLYIGHVIPYSSTAVRLTFTNASTTAVVSSASAALNLSNLAYGAIFTAPITGWNP